MVMVRLLQRIMNDPELGRLVVPIVPDEARTFGMDALFRKFGIYSHVGQTYDPSRGAFVKRKTRKVMVVCSDLSYAPRAQLDCDGWLVIWARDAKNAIAKVRSERFDLAVLVSTGVEMDITETLFNLRDIHHSMPIAVVQPSSDLKDTPSSAAYLPTDHNLIAVQGLDELVRIMQRHRSSIVSQPSRDRPQSNDGRASRSQVALHSPDSNTRSRD
jgi:hypothetical protein